jgi:hypothetical protein
MTPFEIERRADPADRMTLNASAPYVSYRYALDRGWITQAEYHEARKRYGRLWRVDARSRFLRPGHVFMRPLGATGFGGVKAAQSRVEGIERRGWSFHAANRAGVRADA